MDLDGVISAKEHPKSLGHPLTNQYITTDFAEALLELVSPTFSRTDELITWLQFLHGFVATNIGKNDERLWPASMPPILPDPDNFKIAEYGTTHQGQIRNIYRQGLSLRYGRRMQAIAGIHLNLSFTEEFLQLHREISESDDNANTIYLNILRNYIRNSWLINFLLGSSPVMDASFFKNETVPDFLGKHKERSYYHPSSTCLRMGDIGYNNRKHRVLNICFNSIEEYIKTIKGLTKRPEEEYARLGIKNAAGEYRQLNTNLLQIENEYYASIRPKAARSREQKTIDSLAENHTQYLEIRNLDIDPFLPYGVDASRINFMQMFFVYLSLLPSPPIGAEECQYVRQLERQIIMNNLSQDKDFELMGGYILNINDQAEKMLGEMQAVAEILDVAAGKDDYSRAWQHHWNLLNDENSLPAIKQMDFFRRTDMEFVEGMKKIAEQHHSTYNNLIKQDKYEDHRIIFDKEVDRSFAEEEQILAQQKKGDLSLDEFINNYIG